MYKKEANQSETWLITEKLHQGKINLVRQDLMGLNQLIEKLLFLSKDRTAVVRTHVPLDVRKNVKKVIARFASEIKNKRMKMKTSLPAKAKIKISEEYLDILLTNLVSNAVKYGRPGGTISLSAKKAEQTLVLTISDDGPGMRVEEVSRIFDRFYRGNGTPHAGHGIGLAIVKQLCDLFDIEISVTSTPGAGSTFRLKFPPQMCA